MKFAAIVLAAGTSSRFGRNKLLLPFGPRVVIQSTLSQLALAGVESVIVVTGHQAAALRRVLPDNVRVVHNPGYREFEMTGSVQTGLCALAHEIDAAFVVLGDQPLLPAPLVKHMRKSALEHPAHILIPSHKGRRGHPVLFPRRFWPELIALRPGGAPRDIIAQHRDAVTEIPWPDDVILLDVDTPDAYAALLQRDSHS
jgi:molybdenum cofactor cytidylyltransferase